MRRKKSIVSRNNPQGERGRQWRFASSTAEKGGSSRVALDDGISRTRRKPFRIISCQIRRHRRHRQRTRFSWGKSATLAATLKPQSAAVSRSWFQRDSRKSIRTLRVVGHRCVLHALPRGVFIPKKAVGEGNTNGATSHPLFLYRDFVLAHCAIFPRETK